MTDTHEYFILVIDAINTGIYYAYILEIGRGKLQRNPVEIKRQFHQLKLNILWHFSLSSDMYCYALPQWKYNSVLRIDTK